MTRTLVRTDYVRAAAALVRLYPATWDAVRAARLFAVSAAEVRLELGLDRSLRGVA